MKHDDVKALFDRRKVLHTLSRGWGWVRGAFAVAVAPPPTETKGST